jgi:hypothetical protein
MTPRKARYYFFDESWKWWMSVDQNTVWHCTWEEFENASQINGLGIQN